MSAKKTGPRPGVGGRPPKFDEPRRPVTVTLPERSLERLRSLDGDLARAIVKAAELTHPAPEAPAPPVEVIPVSDDAAIIVVGPSRALESIPWLRLAEINPGRYLLTVTPGTSVESLEVAILDLLETLPREETLEREILEQLRQLLRARRQNAEITKFEMLYVSRLRPPRRPSRRPALRRKPASTLRAVKSSA